MAMLMLPSQAPSMREKAARWLPPSAAMFLGRPISLALRIAAAIKLCPSARVMGGRLLQAPLGPMSARGRAVGAHGWRMAGRRGLLPFPNRPLRLAAGAQYGVEPAVQRGGGGGLRRGGRAVHAFDAAGLLAARQQFGELQIELAQGRRRRRRSRARDRRPVAVEVAIDPHRQPELAAQGGGDAFTRGSMRTVSGRVAVSPPTVSFT